MAEKTNKETKLNKVANIWTKYSNPLRYLNNTQIENMLQQSRLGNDSRLQVCYTECEKNTPIFSACINKRIAGVIGRQWDITPIDESAEAKAQADTVRKMFDRSDMLVEDNLTNAIRHLALGSFRGRSAVKPFITEDGYLIFKILENWNFLRYNGKNYWNPSADQAALINDVVPPGVVELPKDEVCYVYDDKPIDWIGITIYLRQLICEESWARLIEKQGIPQVLLNAPDGTPDTDLEKFNYRAQAIYEGASGTLPAGTTVTELNKGAQTDPFTNFISHQSELFCILAVGGTMSTLAGTLGASGVGMGSDVASKQNEQFQSLVNYDCKRIQNALQVAVNKCVYSKFGDVDVKCRFEYVESDETTPAEYLELAQKCKDLGISVDVNKLKQLTKLQFINDEVKDVWTPSNEDK